MGGGGGGIGREVIFRTAASFSPAYHHWRSLREKRERESSCPPTHDHTLPDKATWGGKNRAINFAVTVDLFSCQLLYLSLCLSDHEPASLLWKLKSETAVRTREVYRQTCQPVKRRKIGRVKNEVFQVKRKAAELFREKQNTISQEKNRIPSHRTLIMYNNTVININL